MSYLFAVYQEELAPRAALNLPSRASVRAIYVIHGGLAVNSGEFSGVLGGNRAFHAAGEVQLAAGNSVTWMLRWELIRAGAPEALAAGPGVVSRKLLTVPAVCDSGRRYLLRCERVELPPEGEVRPHTPLGEGIRCLLAGGIDIHTQGAMHRYAPLEPWYETGPHPVYARACPTMVTVLVRVMLLPRALLGKPSIAYVNPEDLDKLEQPAYQLLLDAPVLLPA